MKKNRLLAKWLNDDLSPDELAAFEASPDFEKYQKIKNYTAHLEVGDLDENAMLSNILSQKKTAPKVVPLYKKWAFRAAAIFVLALAVTFVMQFFVPETETADFGKRTTFSLPDNSEVVLNSGSEIQYKKWNWDNSRHLELKGEAYFRVAKGRKFEVETRLGKVTVLGTQFNVKTRKNRFDVVCYEGRVKVNYNNTQILLTHGQSVSFENGKQVNLTVNTSKPEWIDNQIGFYKENIRSLLDEVERQYNIKIELNTKDTTSLFTGKLPAKDLNTALQIISTTYHLEAKQVSKNKIIFDEK
ncbi:FecR family protein [Flavobacterium johnsoniae]|jgi:ferric-dicitrate binding protein FerR (iron transport regulator)|uniref:Anti-FecI sigma factor, FecR n=1 Tax=Flavobacterium johnsoniae (strain ATCC 17061 / DSM 2064 / JCM 8514 / BCRC 14874 / CCUG 350202 / NBRC 14942 / NCIMB 11054 / UW101) TaxID=376686 RepID=A5FNL5_FLAJ1|nr:FecR domain-containing protein [Flavobacterium johnsoniae]ABQ03199.1 anti-FecI sigma factor, FecR [Flavobacterium johnsoniae UW101]OXG01374.1 iron dicitrate transport regulator FecR [Flavobacterium johnsoniae UW101]WQG79940.1 FecR domain-containing protein [Flavobacterium johnsoniae UW101]SHL82375.1 FecR family protein [Flavobacterium johnsoniae]